jgi:hypothetical protein
VVFDDLVRQAIALTCEGKYGENECGSDCQLETINYTGNNWSVGCHGNMHIAYVPFES